MKWKYRYSTNEASFEDAYKHESDWSEENLEYVAEDCAEDYHYNHDGWEDRWPLDFELWNHEGKFLGKFEVNREAVPEFNATLKTEGMLGKIFTNGIDIQCNPLIEKATLMLPPKDWKRFEKVAKENRK